MDSLLTCNKLKEESDSYYKHLQLKNDLFHYYKKKFIKKYLLKNRKKLFNKTEEFLEFRTKTKISGYQL